MSRLFKLDPKEQFDDETVELYKLRPSTNYEQFRLKDHARDSWRGNRNKILNKLKL